jgi:hypothetical protein
MVEPSMTRAGTAALNNSNRNQEISEHRIAKKMKTRWLYTKKVAICDGACQIS